MQDMVNLWVLPTMELCKKLHFQNESEKKI